MKTFSSTVIKNSAFGLAAQFLIKLLSFGFSVLIIRRLGATSYGQYSIVLAFCASLNILSDLGLAPYAVRQVARWKDDPDGKAKTNALFADILVLRIGLSILTALVTIGVAALTDRPLVLVGAIAFSSIGIIIYAIQGSSEAVLAGLERLDLFAGTRVISQLVFVFVGAAVLLLGFGYFGLLGANLLGALMMTIVTWRLVHSQGIRVGEYSAKHWWKLVKASFPFGLIGLALGLSYKFDSVLLGIFRGDTETGYYNAAYNLIFSVLVISNTLNTSLYPSLSRQVVSDPHQLPRIVERALGYLLLISLPIAVGGALLADKLIFFLYTSNYAATIPALQILIWVIPFMFASEFLGYVVVVTDRESRVARAVLISTGVNILLNSLLVPRIGYIAAAIMTVLTEIVLVGQHSWNLKPIMKTLNWNMILLRPAIALAGMAGTILVLKNSIHFIALSFLAGIVYLGLLVLLKVVRKDDFHFLFAGRMQNKPIVPTTPESGPVL